MSSLRQILSPVVSTESTTEDYLLAAEKQMQQKQNDSSYLLPNNTTCDALNNACLAEKRSDIAAKLNVFMQNGTYVDKETNQLLPLIKLKSKLDSLSQMKKYMDTDKKNDIWKGKVDDISNLIGCLEIQDSLTINMQTVAYRSSLKLIHEEFPFDTPVFYKLAKEKLAEFDLLRNSSSSSSASLSYSTAAADENDLKQCCAQVEYFYKTVVSRSSDLCVLARWYEICPSLVEFNMAWVSRLIEKYSLSSFKQAEDLLSRPRGISTVMSTDLNELMKLKIQLQLKDSDVPFSSPESVNADFYESRMNANGEAVFETDKMIECDITKAAESRLSKEIADILLSASEMDVGTRELMQGQYYNEEMLGKIQVAREKLRTKARGK